MDNDTTPPAEHAGRGDFAEIIGGELWRTRKNAARFYERHPRTIDRWRRLGSVRIKRLYQDGYPWTVLRDADLARHDEEARDQARGQARAVLDKRGQAPA